MTFDVLELYDLSIDPLEKNNLKASHPEIASDLLQKLKAWHATLPENPDPECFSKYRAKNSGPLPHEIKPLFEFDPSR